MHCNIPTNYLFMAFLVAMIENRLVILFINKNYLIWSPGALLWILFAFIPDILATLIVLLLLFYVRHIFPDSNRYHVVFGFVIVSFFILILSSNILLLIRTDHSIDWRLVFQLNLASATMLYWSEIPRFICIIFSHFILGIILSKVWYFYFPRWTDARINHLLQGRKGTYSFILALVLLYALILVLLPPTHSWKEPSANVILDIVPSAFKLFRKSEIQLQKNWSEYEISVVDELITVPKRTIYEPTTVLEKPIKHIFIIIMESIRADVLPLNPSFASTIRSSYSRNVTADDISPFFNSLWNTSVRTTASTVASYTLKSLIGTLCGLYPLNVDFLDEVSPENKLYDICLPELISRTFRTVNNQPIFRSAFFTAARDNFDGQRKLVKQMKFDEEFNGFDVSNFNASVPDVGMFGPSDSTILPLLWDWIDKTLYNQSERRLLTSILMTGTHDPFVLPSKEYNYKDYIKDNRANKYLNTIRVADDFLKNVFEGMKSRGLYNDTLFVILGDHGYAFRDWGRKSLATWRVSFECGFLVPLLLHNPNLREKQLSEQFTNMDILPTIMDALLSSEDHHHQSSNYFLNARQDQLNMIFSRYEGTSLFRKPIESLRQRFTFHLDNPGDSNIIVKQYPRKLVYDVHYDDIYLFYLDYDNQESINLIDFDRDDYNGIYPDWLQNDRILSLPKKWLGRRMSAKNYLSVEHKSLLLKDTKRLQVDSTKKNSSNKISLKEMLDWADAAIELASIWTALVRVRYAHGNRTFVF